MAASIEQDVAGFDGAVDDAEVVEIGQGGGQGGAQAGHLLRRQVVDIGQAAAVDGPRVQDVPHPYELHHPWMWHLLEDGGLLPQAVGLLGVGCLLGNSLPMVRNDHGQSDTIGGPCVWLSLSARSTIKDG
jgi:hypothetical protein